jgi:hypothetical protein
MPTPTLRRRISALEAVLFELPVKEFASLTPSEIDEIERRARADDKFTPIELRRIESQSPIVQGSVIVSCHKGDLYVKRYLGLDMSCV